MSRSNRSSSRIDRRRQERRQAAQGGRQPSRRRSGGLFDELARMRLLPKEAERRKGRQAGIYQRAVRAPMARGRQEEDRRMPPVMVRGGLEKQPAPARKRAGTKVRRRYDVALPVAGAEMRLPALPQVRLGWRLLSAILTAALLAVLYQLWNDPGYRVAEAKVEGLQRLSSADVNAVLNIEDEPIFTIEAGSLQTKIQDAFPEFSKVEVKVALRNQVTVKVEERLPILTWRQGDRTVLVDANGYAFPHRPEAPAGPLLTVEAASLPAGVEPGPEESSLTPFMPVEMVSAILSMKGQAPPEAALVYDAQHGLGWKDPQGWQVYFGEVREMGMKLNVYKALANRLRQENLQPVLISVEHAHAPYYRLEQ